MIEPFDTSRLTVQPLTAQAAADTGHIVWIEEKDGGKAIAAMHSAVLKKPFNCAVWANAGDHLSTSGRQLLRDWRAENSVEILNNLIPGGAYVSGLKKVFAEAGMPPSPGFNWLEEHARQTMQQITHGMATRFIHFKLRAGDKRSTLDGYIDAHADGASRWPHIRLLQSLDCQSTYLIDNRDAVFRAVTEEDARNLSAYLNEPLEESLKQVGREEWMLRRESPITLWQAPADSMVMITGLSHHSQPILHSSPVNLPGQTPEKRTVAVYDCRLLM